MLENTKFENEDDYWDLRVRAGRVFLDDFSTSAKGTTGEDAEGNPKINVAPPQPGLLRILFFKTQIGYEVSVMKALAETLQSCGTNARTFFTCGSSDIAVLASADEIAGLMEEAGSLRHVVSCVQAFTDVLSPSSPQKAMKWIADHDLLSFTFVHIATPFGIGASSKDGVEQAFLDWLDGVECPSVVLAPFAGPHFILISPVAEDHSQGVEILELLGSAPGVLATKSLLAISDALMLNPEQSTAGRAITPKGPLLKGAEVHLQATWRQGQVRTLLKESRALRQDLGLDARLYVHTGSEDITIQLRSKSKPHPKEPETPADFLQTVRSILTFRKDLRRSLIATDTKILTKPRKAKLAPKKEGEPRFSGIPALGVAGGTAKWILGLGDLGHAVLRVLFDISDVLDDETSQEDVADLIAFAQFLKREAFAQAKKGCAPDSHQAKRLWRLHWCARQALAQRLHGLSVAPACIVTDNFAPLGGVSRVLRAAAAVPMSISEQMLNSLKTRLEEPWNSWTGMTCLGSNFNVRYNQVIDIPESRAFEPWEWIGLIHETAHSIVDSNRQLFGFLAELHTAWSHLANEVAADLIGFHFGVVWPLDGESEDGPIARWLAAFWRPYRGMSKTTRQIGARRALLLFAAWRQDLHLHRAAPRRALGLVALRSELGELYAHWSSEAPCQQDADAFQVALESHPHSSVGPEEAEFLLQCICSIGRFLPFDHDAMTKRQERFDQAKPQVIERLKDKRSGNLFGLPPELLLWVLRIEWPDEAEVPRGLRSAAMRLLRGSYRRLLEERFEGAWHKAMEERSDPASS